MKAKVIFILTIFLSSILVSASSCKDTTEEEGGGTELSENQKINKWIYDEMSFRYYWNDKIPASSSLDYALSPDRFYFHTLYNYRLPGGDRFSYLENDGVHMEPTRPQSAGEVKANELGFEYYTLSFNDIGYAYCIVYVKKGTDAEAKGLKRGDIIYKVNNVRITNKNYGELLSTGATTYSLELYDQDKTVTVNTTQNYAEHPLLYSDVISKGNKKIGYLVYNFFASDKGDGSYQYAKDVNDVLLDFEKKGIAHLILDLRYNFGGYVISGNYIASAIVPGRGTNSTKIYTKREFNKEYDTYLKDGLNAKDYEIRVTEFFQDYINGKASNPIANLNIQNLYIITSKYTASASEQIINGLNPYIDNLQIVGQTTTGKNMESYEIASSDKSIKWVLHPLTSKSFNSLGRSDYSLGFDPTIGVDVNRAGKYEDDEFRFHKRADGVPSLYPLGNPAEALLSIALADITGDLSKRKMRSGQDNRIEVKPVSSSIENNRSEMIITSPQ